MSEIEYSDLLFQISTKIGGNQLERLVFMCRKQISKGSARTIQNALGLFEELEKRNNLGIDRLETLKQILTQLKNRSMLKKVEEFEIKRKAQSVGIIPSIKQAAVNVKGAIKMVCNFRTIGGALLVVGSGMALHSCSTLDEFVEIFNKVVLVSYTKLIEISEGSLCFTVQAETPVALKELWDIYKDGTLQSRLQEFLVTDDIKHLANGENVEMTVFINEQEYKEAYLDLLQKNQEVPDIKEEGRLWRSSDSFLCSKLNEDEVTLMKLKQMENKLNFERKFHEEEVMSMKLKEKIVLAERLSGSTTIDYTERRRRNSDSAVYFNAKEELPLLRLQCLETELTHLRKRITLLEVKTENLGSCPLEEKETASLRTPDEEFDYKSWDLKKIEKDTRKMEGSEGREIEPTMKLMAIEKMDAVQRYLENVQETYSVTTEASDSGLGTRTAVSEEETEDVRGSSGLCLKDLGKDSIKELDKRLGADVVGFERFLRYFGFKKDFDWLWILHQIGMKEIARTFPDTPVDLIRQCFDALQMYDLIDLLEKAAKPMSLRPVFSLEEVETLRTGNLPTKSHKNVVVLVVNDSSDKDLNGKIEGFFKELNSQNEVTVIESFCSEENRKALEDLEFLKEKKESLIERVERLNSESLTSKSRKSRTSIKNLLSRVKNDATELKEKMERKKLLVEELLKETERAKTIITSALDHWIQNQEEFTAVFLFFIINEKESIYDYDVLAECVASKLTSLPHHTKIVVGAPRSKIVADVPEILSFGFPHTPIKYSVYNAMIEIFIKRHPKLDLVSMLRELKRTHREINSVIFGEVIDSNLSTLPIFEKKREQEPERS